MGSKLLGQMNSASNGFRGLNLPSQHLPQKHCAQVSEFRTIENNDSGSTVVATLFSWEGTWCLAGGSQKRIHGTYGNFVPKRANVTVQGK